MNAAFYLKIYTLLCVSDGVFISLQRTAVESVQHKRLHAAVLFRASIEYTQFLPFYSIINIILLVGIKTLLSGTHRFFSVFGYTKLLFGLSECGMLAWVSERTPGIPK
jgi:hypothetical protein